MRVVCVRVDDSTYEVLSRRASEHGVSVYMYVKELLQNHAKRLSAGLDVHGVVRMLDDILEWIRVVHNYYDNLDSIAKRLESVKKALDDLMVDFDAVVGYIEDMVKNARKTLEATPLCEATSEHA
jgi:hypothetical protein